MVDTLFVTLVHDAPDLDDETPAMPAERRIGVDPIRPRADRRTFATRIPCEPLAKDMPSPG